MGTGSMKFAGWFAAFIILLMITGVLGGCTSIPAPVENPRQVWCDNNTQRRPTLATVRQMTRPELDELNAYNAKGADWCGWKP